MTLDKAVVMQKLDSCGATPACEVCGQQGNWNPNLRTCVLQAEGQAQVVVEVLPVICNNCGNVRLHATSVLGLT